MSEQTVEPGRLSPSELRTLFLFEKLDDDQLAWLSDNGYCETRLGGQPIYSEGDPATCFFVLLSGTMSMHRRVENTEVETGRTNQRGVYSGATQSFVKAMSEVPYWGSARAVTDCDFWVIGAAEFGEKFREWFPMAMHLLEGLTMGFRSSQVIIGQRERLLSLGRLSAGLTHELQQSGGRCRTRHGLAAGTGKQRCAASSPTWRLPTSTPRLWWRSPSFKKRRWRRWRRPRNCPRCRSARLRTRSPTGSMIMALTTAGTWLRRWSPPGSIRTGWTRSPRLCRRSARRRTALGRLRLGDRAADGGDRGLDRPHLGTGRSGQAVLPDGSSGPSGDRRPRRAEQHTGHARPQDQGIGQDQDRQGLSTNRCR